MTEYAIYKGEELQFIGTVDECAAFRGVKPETIRWYSTPRGQRRADARKKQDKALRIIRPEEDEE